MSNGIYLAPLQRQLWIRAVVIIDGGDVIDDVTGLAVVLAVQEVATAWMALMGSPSSGSS